MEGLWPKERTVLEQESTARKFNWTKRKQGRGAEKRTDTARPQPVSKKFAQYAPRRHPGVGMHRGKGKQNPTTTRQVATCEVTMRYKEGGWGGESHGDEGFLGSNGQKTTGHEESGVTKMGMVAYLNRSSGRQPEIPGWPEKQFV